MSTPDKLLEPDRYHWMAFPLDRTPASDTAVLEPETESRSIFEAPSERGDTAGRDAIARGSEPSTRPTNPGRPPVRERVFNPELKEATQQVLEHPADNGPEPSAVGGLTAAGAVAAVAVGVGKSATEQAPADLDDSEIEGMIHADELDADETRDLDADDDELSIDELHEAPAADGRTAAHEAPAADEAPAASEASEAREAPAADGAPATDATSADTGAELAPADLSWIRPVPPPMPPTIVESLFHLFEREDVQNQDFMSIMEYIRSEAKADALAGMLFDPIDFVYRLYLHDGIDPHTRKNIFFALNDNFLDSDSPISVLRFADFKGDFFFSKRFSTEFFKNMQGAVLLNLNVYELPGYFMLFYRDLSVRDDDVLRGLSESIVRDLVPLVQRLRRVNGLVHYRTTLEDSRDNYTLRLYQLLKELSHSGKDPIRVIQVNFRAEQEGGAIRPYLIQICEKLRMVLGPRERVAILPPGRLSVMLKSDEVDAVLEVVKSISNEAGLTPDWKVMRYPESGRNLLNYLR